MAADRIELEAARAVNVNVRVQRICGLRILQRDVDLARNALIALSGRTCALADVDLVDPVTGDEHEPFDHA